MKVRVQYTPEESHVPIVAPRVATEGLLMLISYIFYLSGSSTAMYSTDDTNARIGEKEKRKGRVY